MKYLLHHLSLVTYHLLLLVSLSCSAQRAYHTVDFKASAKNFVDSISIEWNQNQVYVPVTMNGRQYRFLLDTGSGHVVYDDTPINGCREIGAIRSFDANNHTDTVKLLELPPITVGSVSFTGCQATLHHRAYRGPRSFDGVLGFDLMAKNISAKIDVAARLLILTDRKNFFDHEGGSTAKYKLNHFVPYVEVSPFVGYSESVLFDTGSPNIYRMNRQSYDAAQKAVGDLVFMQTEGHATGRYAIGLHGTEARGDVVFLTLDRLRLGDYSFTQLHTLTTQGDSHVGAGVLNYGAVVVNARKRQLRFLPYNDSVAVAINNRQLDIAFVSDHGRPAVGLVWQFGEPYEKGFREGDIILKINGRSVPDFLTFSNWYYEPGREYTFTLQDSRGFTREVKWVRIPSSMMH